MEAQANGSCYDGRRQSWDFLTLPGEGKWLRQVQLLVTDQQHVLMYDRQLALLGALTFSDRPVSGQTLGGTDFREGASPLACSPLLMFCHPPLATCHPPPACASTTSH